MRTTEENSTQTPEKEVELILKEENLQQEERKVQAKKTFNQLVSNDDEEKVEWSFYTILGGELMAYLLRKQVKFIALLTFMTVLYVTNRYAFQKELVINKELNEQLEDRRLRAVVATSNLVEYTRRSNIQEELSDTTLRQTDIPHRYIKLKTSTQ